MSEWFVSISADGTVARRMSRTPTSGPYWTTCRLDGRATKRAQSALDVGQFFDASTAEAEPPYSIDNGFIDSGAS